MLPIASETVTVMLPASTAFASLTGFGDAGAAGTSVLQGTGGAFQAPVRSAFSVLKFQP